MTIFQTLRRALLPGLFIAVAGCDVIQFASDPGPRLVQTWNLAASSSTIGVDKFLPAGVTIYSTPPANNDSIGFSVTVNNVAISQVLGTTTSGCTACVALNGTNAIKPAFTLTANNATPLPSNVVSAAVLNGQVQLNITNNLSFDPLYVNTGGGSPPQGSLVITIKSTQSCGAATCSVLLAADTVVGAATVTSVGGRVVASPFAPGTTLARTIQLQTGNVTTNVTADVVFTSPAGDHLVPINVNSTVNATFGIPQLVVASVLINVPSTNITPSTPTNLPADLDESMTDHVIRGTLEMTIANPFAISGNLNAQFQYGTPAQVVTKAFALPASTATTPQVRALSFDSTEMANIFKGNPTVLTMSGGVSSAAPLTVTPKQKVSISNRLILAIRVGGN